jgi:hypothetical protein
MTIRPLTLTGLALALGMSACAHSTYQAPSPTVSKNGVAVSVVSDERCFITREDEKLPPPTNDNKFHLRVSLRFQNDSAGTAGVATEHVRLTADGPGAHTEMSPLGATTLTLQAGQSQIVPLDFERTGPLDCHQPLDLETRDAVSVDGKPVAFESIRLIAAKK